MSSSVLLLILVGMAVVGNTIVGGLPDKILALSTKPSAAAVTNPNAGANAAAATAQAAAGLTAPAAGTPAPGGAGSNTSTLTGPTPPGLVLAPTGDGQ